ITLLLSTERDHTASTSFDPSSASCGAIDPVTSGPEIATAFVQAPSAERDAAWTRQPLPEVPAQTATARPLSSTTTSGADVPVWGSGSGIEGCHAPPAGRKAAWTVHPVSPTLDQTATASPRAFTATSGAWASRPEADSEVGVDHARVRESRLAAWTIRF